MIHGMVPMIRNLRPEPPMDGHDEVWIRCDVSNLPSVRQRPVLNVDLPESRLQLSQSWHIMTVDPGRIGEITAAKLLCFLLEMALDQPDLFFIRWILDGNRLPPAVIEPLKDMDRLFKIEWHHLCTACCHLGLAVTSCQYSQDKDDPEEGNYTEDRYAGRGIDGLWTD